MKSRLLLSLAGMQFVIYQQLVNKGGKTFIWVLKNSYIFSFYPLFSELLAFFFFLMNIDIPVLIHQVNQGTCLSALLTKRLTVTAD